MEKKANNKKRIGVLIGSIAGFLAAYLAIQAFWTPQSFDKQMMETASKLNESCPMMVDRQTRLDSALALPDNVFQYNYTLVSLAKDSINIPILEEFLKPHILKNVKTNPDMKAYRDNKVTMAYCYKDKNGVFITKVIITPEQYAK